MGAKNMTREARDMELQWFDIRELTEDAAQTVIGMMDETRRRRVADIAGEDDRKRTIAGELLARRMLAQTMGCAEKDVPLQWDELGKPRGGQLAKLCQETGADGVIVCMVKFCAPEEYDQPWLEKDLRSAGHPCVSIEIDQQNASFEQIRTRVQTFCESL